MTKALQTIDFDDLDDASQQTKKVGVVFNDDNEPVIGFIIKSKDSEEYRSCGARLRASAIKRQAVTSSRIDRSTDEGAVKLDEVLQTNEDELAIAVTVDFFGFTHQGKPLEFSKDMVRKIFSKKPTWREKVTAALEDEESFLRLYTASSKSSLAISSGLTSEEKTESPSEKP
jgi:hypothetical protein